MLDYNANNIDGEQSKLWRDRNKKAQVGQQGSISDQLRSRKKQIWRRFAEG